MIRDRRAGNWLIQEKSEERTVRYNIDPDHPSNLSTNIFIALKDHVRGVIVQANSPREDLL